MLQKFLDQALISISDDANFDKLKKASTEITKKITKNKSKIISYTLTVLDPNISPENPDIGEVKTIISEKWATFSSNYKDTPMTYIRAVMLDALETVSSDINIACLIWFTGRNIQKHFNIIDKERELISNFLVFLGERIEEEALKNWGLPSNTNLQQISSEFKKPSEALLEKHKLELHLKAASLDKKSGGDNTYSQGEDEAFVVSEWAESFSSRASQGISDEINKVFKDFSTKQVQIQETVQRALLQAQNEILEKNYLLQLRTQLIWWKEACYSTSAKASYREFETGVLQFLLANDYSNFIPTIYPASVDFFLKEAHKSLVPDEKQSLSILKILESLKESKSFCRTLMSETITKSGRITFLDFIKGYVWDKYDIGQFEQLVGFSTSQEIQLSNFIIWLFHDLHSAKILNQ